RRAKITVETARAVTSRTPPVKVIFTFTGANEPRVTSTRSTPCGTTLVTCVTGGVTLSPRRSATPPAPATALTGDPARSAGVVLGLGSHPSAPEVPMGREIGSIEYTRSQRTLYRRELRRNLDLFENFLDTAEFVDEGTVGV